LVEIRGKVESLNRTAGIVETNFARVDDAQLSMLQPQLHDDFVRRIRRPFYSEPEASPFHSFTVRFKGLLNETRFSEWFRYFASLHQHDVFRIKGFVIFEDNPLLGMVQSVGGKVSISEGSVINPFEPLENVLVFIGKKISKFEIEMEIQHFLLQDN
jgi:G3E family GTPase